MTCPTCRHENPTEARFCAQCGAPLTPPAAVAPATTPAAVPPAQPAGRKTRARALAIVVVLLLLGLAGYVALRLTARAATSAPAAAQTTAPANDSSASAGATLPRAPALTPAIGAGAGAGAGAKGEPAPEKAPDTPPQAGAPGEPHDRPSAGTSGTPDAADGAPAANALGGLLGALSSAVGGVHRHDPVDFHTLETLVPSSLPGMEGTPPEGKADDTMSIKSTSAHVEFTGPDNARIALSITDATAISGLAGVADAANANGSAQGDSYEKNETIDGRRVREKWDAPARHGELSLSVGQRFEVEVVGDNVGMDVLKNALAHIDLAKLESLKDANPLTK